MVPWVLLSPKHMTTGIGSAFLILGQILKHDRATGRLPFHRFQFVDHG